MKIQEKEVVVTKVNKSNTILLIEKMKYIVKKKQKRQYY